jgi:ATP-dependent Clp protease ATP-binding subunit ClpC
MFDDEEAVITMDMSEFMEKHNASRLVGAPPGYVGYEEGGQLTEKVRRRPYCVVLLDEIEKAHPDVFNMLLQVMEEGRLTDSFGRHVDFRNVILIMTSNLGSHVMKAGSSLGFGKPTTTESSIDRKDKMKIDVMHEVERHFRPEFLNRIDELVIFNPLEKDHIAKIVRLQLIEVFDRVRDRGITIEIAEDGIDFLMTKGFDENYGARPMRRAIERYIEDPLAEQVLQPGFDEKKPLLITVEGPVEDAEALAFLQTEPVAPTGKGAKVADAKANAEASAEE